MGQENLLIVEQRPNPPEALQELLTDLSREHGLDAYTCRQRLLGQGRALLHKGSRESLLPISSQLSRGGFRHWLIEPHKPLFPPAAIRGLEQDETGVTFAAREKKIYFPNGAKVLAVLADLSGKLVEQSVKQLMASHAYQGLDNVSHISAGKTYKTILQGKPVLDLYLLDDQNAISAAVRVFPGKFDHRGLGGRATASSRQNLHQLLEMIRERSGETILETGFGLDNLPGCRLQNPADDNPDTLRKNLISLARFGWLMADLHQQGVIAEKDETGRTETAALLSAAFPAQGPAVAAAAELESAAPLNSEIASAIEKASAAADSGQQPEETSKTRSLPAPPPARSGQHWRTPRFWFGSLGGLVAVVVIFLFEQVNGLPSLARYGFQLGIIPALLGALMFWGGFHFLRLKRLVENTPTSKIRSVAMGMVEIKGRALRQYALLSPMTHTACAWYRLTRYRRNRNRNWVVSSVVSSGNVPFLLEDETGRISVDPDGATVKPKARQEGAPGRTSLLHGAGIADSDLSEKWVEELIYEGTILYVLGSAAVKKTAGPDLREKKIAALRELKRDPQTLKAFDADGDGHISAAEWETARATVEDRVLRESLTGNNRRRRQEEQIVITKPRGGRPFIVAETHSEAQLTTRFALYTIPLFTGAAGCIGWAVALLVKWLTQMT